MQSGENQKPGQPGGTEQLEQGQVDGEQDRQNGHPAETMKSLDKSAGFVALLTAQPVGHKTCLPGRPKHGQHHGQKNQ